MIDLKLLTDEEEVFVRVALLNGDEYEYALDVIEASREHPHIAKLMASWVEKTDLAQRAGWDLYVAYSRAT